MRWSNLGDSPSAPFGTEVVSRTIDTAHSSTRAGRPLHVVA
ncbi:hypothetical protein [Streptomyces sp. NPDC058773]